MNSFIIGKRYAGLVKDHLIINTNVRLLVLDRSVKNKEAGTSLVSGELLVNKPSRSQPGYCVNKVKRKIGEDRRNLRIAAWSKSLDNVGIYGSVRPGVDRI